MQSIKQFLRKENEEKLDFWKIQSQTGVGDLSRNAVETLFFGLKGLASKASRMFSTHRATMLKESKMYA